MAGGRLAGRSHPAVVMAPEATHVLGCLSVGRSTLRSMAGHERPAHHRPSERRPVKPCSDVCAFCGVDGTTEAVLRGCKPKDIRGRASIRHVWPDPEAPEEVETRRRQPLPVRGAPRQLPPLGVHPQVLPVGGRPPRRRGATDVLRLLRRRLAVQPHARGRFRLSCPRYPQTLHLPASIETVRYRPGGTARLAQRDQRRNRCQLGTARPSTSRGPGGRCHAPSMEIELIYTSERRSDRDRLKRLPQEAGFAARNQGRVGAGRVGVHRYRSTLDGIDGQGHDPSEPDF